MAAAPHSSDPAERYRLSTRWLLFFLGVSIMTVGIAISVHAGLGTSPISSAPAVLVEVVPLSFGTITVIMNLLFVLIQIALLRSRFSRLNYLQFLVAFFFGAMSDLSLRLTSFLQPENYFQQWVLVVLGAAIVALGVFIQVLPKILYVPGEGIVAAIAMVTGWKFGTVKQCVDWALVIIAAALSLLFLQDLVGVREGTVFAAFAVGGMVKFYQRIHEAASRRA